jgi:hypothetical protein
MQRCGSFVSVVEDTLGKGRTHLPREHDERTANFPTIKEIRPAILCAPADCAPKIDAIDHLEQI